MAYVGTQANCTEVVNLFSPYFLVPEWRNNKEKLLSICTFGFPLNRNLTRVNLETVLRVSEVITVCMGRIFRFGVWHLYRL